MQLTYLELKAVQPGQVVDLDIPEGWELVQVETIDGRDPLTLATITTLRAHLRREAAPVPALPAEAPPVGLAAVPYVPAGVGEGEYLVEPTASNVADFFATAQARGEA